MKMLLLRLAFLPMLFLPSCLPPENPAGKYETRGPCALLTTDEAGKFMGRTPGEFKSLNTCNWSSTAGTLRIEVREASDATAAGKVYEDAVSEREDVAGVEIEDVTDLGDEACWDAKSNQLFVRTGRYTLIVASTKMPKMDAFDVASEAAALAIPRLP